MAPLAAHAVLLILAPLAAAAALVLMAPQVTPLVLVAMLHRCAACDAAGAGAMFLRLGSFCNDTSTASQHTAPDSHHTRLQTHQDGL
jgi:hypothetical protein